MKSFVRKKIVSLPSAPAAILLLAGWFLFCLLFLAGVSLLLWKWPVVFPQENSVGLSGEVLGAEVLGADESLSPSSEAPDERIVILEQFLNKKDSPLASQAPTMIEVADTYKFDWRLLPAIAGKESSYGKNIPWDSDEQSSHNAWGWGVYGDKAPTFSSWEEAIETIAEGLRHEYYNEGHINPELIMKKFTPRSDGSWARDVEVIMEQIAPSEKQNDSED